MKRNALATSANKVCLILILVSILFGGSGALCSNDDDLPGFNCGNKLWTCQGGQCVGMTADDVHKFFEEKNRSQSIEGERPSDYTSTPDEPSKDVKLDSDKTDVTKHDADMSDPTSIP